MLRTLAVLIFPLCVAACTVTSDWPKLSLARQDGDIPLAFYRFDWQLSGDRAVAPFQVFDDGRRTWLQFSPGQPVPAIFEHTNRGERPLPHTREGPYVVLPGVWDALMFRGGTLQGLARRMPSDDATATPVEAGIAATPVEPQAEVLPLDSKDAITAQTAPEEAAAVSILSAKAPAQTLQTTDSVTTALPVAGMEADPAPVEHYDVSPRDLTLRAALARWAGLAGWTFEPEHWTVDADIPIVGSAHFSLAFKPAVQELVAATELADKPLQPCFYSNRVLRIVPYAQPCDRTVGNSGTS